MDAKKIEELLKKYAKEERDDLGKTGEFIINTKDIVDMFLNEKETLIELISGGECLNELKQVDNDALLDAFKFTDLIDGKYYYIYIKPYNEVMKFRAEEQENAITNKPVFKLENKKMFLLIDEDNFEGWDISKSKFNCL